MIRTEQAVRKRKRIRQIEMKRGVSSNGRASLVFSLVLSDNSAARVSKRLIKKVTSCSAARYCTSLFYHYWRYGQSLRADFREDCAAEAYERPAVFRQFLGDRERMRGDDRYGPSQLQFLILGR